MGGDTGPTSNRVLVFAQQLIRSERRGTSTIAEYDTVKFKKDGKLYTVLEVCTDSKTGMPYYYLEAQDEDGRLRDADPSEIEFVSRTGNPTVDELLKDAEKRPLF